MKIKLNNPLRSTVKVNSSTFVKTKINNVMNFRNTLEVVFIVREKKHKYSLVQL